MAIKRRAAKANFHDQSGAFDWPQWSGPVVEEDRGFDYSSIFH
jgi:hypothetical protein